jgi:hypothetical protein
VVVDLVDCLNPALFAARLDAGLNADLARCLCRLTRRSLALAICGSRCLRMGSVNGGSTATLTRLFGLDDVKCGKTYCKQKGKTAK